MQKNILDGSPIETKLTGATLVKLRESCNFREDATKKLFCKEFTGGPECFLTGDGKPFHGNKASILNLIEPPDETLTIVSLADTYIVDLSGF